MAECAIGSVKLIWLSAIATDTELSPASGTTFHATCLLNADDGGERQPVLVTNNEVAEVEARQLYPEGYYRGDPTFEAAGIFQRVTRPRCEAVVSGTRPDGTPIAGKYLGGRPLSRGFAENVEFFQLDYLDISSLEARQRSCWMSRGSGPMGWSDNS